MTASTSQDPSHLSIGEVLNILREEFSDITISKIRFLESQGLIDPERTPSGYRKFYEADVARLRWILHQQKENFLPLKVIKERLEQMSDGEQPAPVSSIAPRSATGIGQRRRPRRSPPDPSVAPPLPFDAPAPDRERASRPQEPVPGPTPAAEAPPRREPAPARSREPAPEPAAVRESVPASEPVPARPATQDAPGLTRVELARAVGLDESQLADLESFGLVIAEDDDGDEAIFGEEAQAIAKAAAGFYSHGINARHLRMYKLFADREAALFEQVSMHYLRQRNPGARVKAQEELATLTRLGRTLRAALLVQAIRSSLAE
jgi:DNA-binding transcriptional MerR regulator